MDKNGEKTSAMRYKPWGEVRPETAYVKQDASITPSYRLSDYTFTGQRSYMDDPTTTGATEGFGLMFYNARWYDPQLGRFAQADTIVAGENYSGAQSTQDVASIMYTALTVSYSEGSINAKHNADNAFIQKFGGSLANASEREKRNARIRNVPLLSQSFDRYVYGLNNPLRYKDPTGHIAGDSGGNKDVNYRSYLDGKGRVVYRLEYFGEVMYVYETKETENMITNFAQRAREYASSVKSRETLGAIFVGSAIVMVFGAAVAGFSGGTLAWLGGWVAVGGAVVAIGSGQQYIDAGEAMVDSKNGAKLYFDALKPFSGLDPLNMDGLLPLPPLPFNQ